MSKSTFLLMLLSLILFGMLSTYGQAIHEYDPNSTPSIIIPGQGGNVIDGDGDWFTFTSLPAASSTSGAGCAYLNGKIYHFGGSPGPTADYLEWDEATDVWTPLGTMPGGIRYYLSAETVAGNIYVIGGSQVWPTPSGLVEIFDGGTWSTGTPMPIPLKDIATAVYQDRYIYVVGGMIGSWVDFSDAVQIYDTQTDTWAVGTSFPMLAGTMAGGCVGNIIVVAGPYDGSSSNAIYEGEINLSDPTDITWTLSTGTLTEAVYRCGGGAAGDAYINNMAFFVGGNNGVAPYSNQALGYDPTGDVVTVYPVKPAPMSNIPNFVPGINMMYVMGGYDGVIPYNLTCEGMEYDMIPIPVELTSFTASVNENDVTLNWVTATEVNNQGFEIQRNSGNDFQAVGFVNGHGTTTEVQEYSFTDVVAPGAYSYRLKQVDYDGTSEYSDVVEVDITVPDVFALEQNYPNPFNPSTQIDFSLAADSKVTLNVFSLLGEKVATIVNSNLAAGSHQVDFNAANLNSGVYFYRIEATGIDGTNFTNVKKMILTK